MLRHQMLLGSCAAALGLMVALGACAKLKPTDVHSEAQVRAQAKRQQAACASSAAQEQLKGLLFDSAIGRHSGGRENLDSLADYSFVRMERPVVKGWDPALDIIKCKGRLVLAVPPGAERAFDGAHQLQADVDYTAQAAADGRGFVYQIEGADPIVAKLAAFNMRSGAFQPPPAIDQPGEAVAAPTPAQVARAEPRPAPAPTETRAAQVATPSAPTRTDMPRRVAYAEDPRQAPEREAASGGSSGESTIRAFYDSLGAGDGGAASARVIPEKRSSRTYSPEAMSRFYGRLPEPIRLTQITAVGPGTYRVSYRYSAGRSRCNGSAIISTSRRDGRDLIRSIRALSGC